ncbi:MAG: hypothetical protein H6733_08185 [Alphaproteobacteria bacterium]|nr:hypothetical protein [Alphaproteobacteria bacterium]
MTEPLPPMPGHAVREPEPLADVEPDAGPIPPLPTSPRDLLALPDPAALQGVPDPEVVLPDLPELRVSPDLLTVAVERTVVPWQTAAWVDDVAVHAILDPTCATTTLDPPAGPVRPRRVRLDTAGPRALVLHADLPEPGPGATLRIGRDVLAGRIDVRVDPR